MTAFSLLQELARTKSKLISDHEIEIKTCEDRMRALRRMITTEQEEVTDIRRTLSVLTGNPFPGKSLNGVDVIAGSIRLIKEEMGTAPDYYSVTEEEMAGYRHYFDTRGFKIPAPGNPIYCEGVELKVLPKEPQRPGLPPDIFGPQ